MPLSLASPPCLSGHPHAPLIERARRLSAASVTLAARMHDADAVYAAGQVPGSALGLVQRELRATMFRLAESLGMTLLDLEGACRALEAAGLLGEAEEIRRATREGMQDGGDGDPNG